MRRALMQPNHPLTVGICLQYKTGCGGGSTKNNFETVTREDRKRRLDRQILGEMMGQGAM